MWNTAAKLYIVKFDRNFYPMQADSFLKKKKNQVLLLVLLHWRTAWRGILTTTGHITIYIYIYFFCGKSDVLTLDRLFIDPILYTGLHKIPLWLKLLVNIDDLRVIIKLLTGCLQLVVLWTLHIIYQSGFGIRECIIRKKTYFLLKRYCVSIKILLWVSHFAKEALTNIIWQC